MKLKWILFTGIVLLTIGILLKKFSDLSFEPILLIITGVLLKIYYLIGKARSGEYKPGVELGILLVGLLLFLSGLYARSHETAFNAAYLIITGITLKVIFVILAISKMRSQRKKM
jgi:hypothetical protein